MASTQTYIMSDQRRRIAALVKEAGAWKVDYDKTSGQESKEVYNRLCDTLDACNAWLLAYEGTYRVVNNLEMGPVSESWKKIA